MLTINNLDLGFSFPCDVWLWELVSLFCWFFCLSFFSFLTTTRNCQGLFLALHSLITLDNALGARD